MFSNVCNLVVIGHRYIELFLRSELDESSDDWNSGDQSFFSNNGMNFSNSSGGKSQF